MTLSRKALPIVSLLSRICVLKRNQKTMPPYHCSGRLKSGCNFRRISSVHLLDRTPHI
nr:MAG TPA: hypothetical protein [Caudoviricetes sp.]